MRPTSDIQYAGGTLLIVRTTKQLTSMLHAPEKHVLQHGRKLNTEKTALLTHTRQTTPKLFFLNGEQIPITTQVTYLGSMISWEKLFIDRLSAQSSKLRLFPSVCIPTLFFGLDSLILTGKHIARVDVYYLRFLRRIVNIKASYLASLTTLDTVWHTANYPRKLSSFLQNARHMLIIAVFQAPIEDRLHNVVCNSAHKDSIVT